MVPRWWVIVTLDFDYWMVAMMVIHVRPDLQWLRWCFRASCRTIIHSNLWFVQVFGSELLLMQNCHIHCVNGRKILNQAWTRASANKTMLAWSWFEQLPDLSSALASTPSWTAGQHFDKPHAAHFSICFDIHDAFIVHHPKWNYLKVVPVNNWIELSWKNAILRQAVTHRQDNP